MIPTGKQGGSREFVCSDSIASKSHALDIAFYIWIAPLLCSDSCAQSFADKLAYNLYLETKPQAKLPHAAI